jgi:23S rRNA (adenine2030-N6)-methyltransferase
MNYRHAYHAGNFADVLKHIVLVHCLIHLGKKPAAYRVVDTHAGAGRYRLDAGEASRTGEWKDGVGRVLAAAGSAPASVKAILTPYLELIAPYLGNDGQLLTYPGSPVLAASLLRAGDQLIANELHPDDGARLKTTLASDRQAKVMGLDGWTAIKALLPPPERRGLVLVDPPFEEPGELIRLTEGLDHGLSRFSRGTFLLWYPIKDMKPVERFRRGVREVVERHAIETVLDAELLLRPARHPDLLNGCGLVIVNPPHTLAGQLEILLPWLAKTVGDAGARGTLLRLTAERN